MTGDQKTWMIDFSLTYKAFIKNRGVFLGVIRQKWTNPYEIPEQNHPLYNKTLDFLIYEFKKCEKYEST